MKNKRHQLLSCFVLTFIFSYSFAQQYVDGYTKKDGTYVQGHIRSKPNNNTYDNYKQKGDTYYSPYESNTRRDNRQINSGPNGGRYYIDSYGNKQYVKQSDY